MGERRIEVHSLSGGVSFIYTDKSLEEVVVDAEQKGFAVTRDEGGLSLYAEAIPTRNILLFREWLEPSPVESGER